MDTLTLVGVIVIAVFSITSHEAAHGFAADRLGDATIFNEREFDFEFAGGFALSVFD